MKFKITSEPTSHLGGTRYVERAGFKVGDVVEVPNPEVVDSDGDVLVSHEGGPVYLVRSCLTPADTLLSDEGVVQISAVRAALVALGIEADVVAVAQAIEAAVS